MSLERIIRLERAVRGLDERLEAVEARKKHCNSIEGVDCVDCGVPAQTRWGRGGDPVCKPCYSRRYKRQ